MGGDEWWVRNQECQFCWLFQLGEMGGGVCDVVDGVMMGGVMMGGARMVRGWRWVVIQ